MGVGKTAYACIGSLHELAGVLLKPGQVHKCKTGMHGRIRPGDRVLFAGIGLGGDAMAAAERGARVTVVDLSRDHLDALSRRASNRSFLHPLVLVHQDVFAFEGEEAFDYVFANFFLDIFPRVMVFPALEHLAGQVRRGGCMVIGDFAPPAGWSVSRMFQITYWYCADIFLHLVSRTAIHPVYDYRCMLRSLGFIIEEVRYYRVLFDERFCAILARKA